MHIAKISNFFKKNYLIYFITLAIFFIIYSATVNLLKSYSNLKKNNFNTFLNSDEFNNMTDYVFENLNSPYREYNYIVENNDTIEKILKKYNINTDDINKIASAVIENKITVVLDLHEQ